MLKSEGMNSLVSLLCWKSDIEKGGTSVGWEPAVHIWISGPLDGGSAINIRADARHPPVPERGSYSHLPPSLLGHRCEWMWNSRNLRSRDMLQHRWQLHLHLPSRLHASERWKQLHGWVCVSWARGPGSHLQRSVKHLGLGTALPRRVLPSFELL